MEGKESQQSMKIRVQDVLDKLDAADANALDSGPSQTVMGLALPQDNSTATIGAQQSGMSTGLRGEDSSTSTFTSSRGLLEKASATASRLAAEQSVLLKRLEDSFSQVRLTLPSSSYEEIRTLSPPGRLNCLFLHNFRHTTSTSSALKKNGWVIIVKFCSH